MEEVELTALSLLQYIPVIVPSDIVPIFWWSQGSIWGSESIVISDKVHIAYSANFWWPHLGHYNRYVLYLGDNHRQWLLSVTAGDVFVQGRHKKRENRRKRDKRRILTTIRA